MNTIPPNDFSYFEMINDLVQQEPADALEPEIMGSLAAIGIVKGKPFEPDARMKKNSDRGGGQSEPPRARTVNWHRAMPRFLLLPRFRLDELPVCRRLQV